MHETYQAIFNGEQVVVNGVLLSTDGVNWLVDNEPTDTVDNKKKNILR